MQINIASLWALSARACKVRNLQCLRNNGRKPYLDHYLQIEKPDSAQSRVLSFSHNSKYFPDCHLVLKLSCTLVKRQHLKQVFSLLSCNNKFLKEEVREIKYLLRVWIGLRLETMATTFNRSILVCDISNPCSSFMTGCHQIEQSRIQLFSMHFT